MSNNQNDDLGEPQPDDDDETLRRKLRASRDQESARMMEGMLHDPTYLAFVRRAILRAREARARGPAPPKKPYFLSTGEFKLALALVEGKLMPVPMSDAEATEGDVEALEVSGEREIQGAKPRAAVVATALAVTKRPETVDGLGALGASVTRAGEATAPAATVTSPARGDSTIEMATLPRPIAAPVALAGAAATASPDPRGAGEPDDAPTVMVGRYSDDPRVYQGGAGPQQVVRAEPRGNVSTSALGLMQTEAMAARRDPEAQEAASAWTAGEKPKIKVMTDRVPTVARHALAAAGGGVVASDARVGAAQSGRRVTERMVTGGALQAKDDAAQLPLSGGRGRIWAIAVATVVLAIGYAVLRSRPESSDGSAPNAATDSTPTAATSNPSAVPSAAGTRSASTAASISLASPAVPTAEASAAVEASAAPSPRIGGTSDHSASGSSRHFPPPPSTAPAASPSHHPSVPPTQTARPVTPPVRSGDLPND